MVRLKLALIIGGGVLVFFGIQEWRLGSGCKSEAQKIKCSDLEAKGPGENAHIILTDFCLPNSSIIYNKDTKSGKYTCIWVPAVPNEGDYVKQYREAMQAGTQPSGPTGIKVIVESKNVKNDAQLDEFGNKTEIEGTIVNKIESLGSDERKLLVSSYPGSSIDACYILEEGRKPAGTGALAGFLLGGLALVGVGVALFAAGK